MLTPHFEKVLLQKPFGFLHCSAILPCFDSVLGGMWFANASFSSVQRFCFGWRSPVCSKCFSKGLLYERKQKLQLSSSLCAVFNFFMYNQKQLCGYFVALSLFLFLADFNGLLTQQQPHLYLSSLENTNRKSYLASLSVPSGSSSDNR